LVGVTEYVPCEANAWDVIAAELMKFPAVLASKVMNVCTVFPDPTSNTAAVADDTDGIAVVGVDQVNGFRAYAGDPPVSSVLAVAPAAVVPRAP